MNRYQKIRYKTRQKTSQIGWIALAIAGYLLYKSSKGEIVNIPGLSSGSSPGANSAADAIPLLTKVYKGGSTYLSNQLPDAADVGRAAVEGPLWVADRVGEASVAGVQAAWDWGYKKGSKFGRFQRQRWNVGIQQAKNIAPQVMPIPTAVIKRITKKKKRQPISQVHDGKTYTLYPDV